MKKLRLVGAALILCMAMSLCAQAAPVYQSDTIRSYDGYTFTFSAARKVTETFPYDDSAYVYTAENVDVYLLQPGSAVTVTAPDGSEGEYKSPHYLWMPAVGHYGNLTVDYNRLRSGTADAWFERSDMARIVTERVTEPYEESFGDMFISGEKIISQTVVYVRLDTGVIPHAQQPAAPAFTDVKESDYYYAPIQWAVENGVTTGTSATTFSPASTCTTAQILTFLWRAVGSPAPAGENPFSDVAEDVYYADAAVWAHEQGLVSGETFGGDAPCTRSAVVTYLWKLAEEPEAEAAAFTDVAADADYAQAVAWAVSEGITTGTSAATFSPDSTCTRGQIVTFLYRDLAEAQE